MLTFRAKIKEQFVSHDITCLTLTCYVNSCFVNGDVVLCPRDMLSNYELPNERRERQSEALVTAIRASHEDT